MKEKKIQRCNIFCLTYGQINFEILFSLKTIFSIILFPKLFIFFFTESRTVFFKNIDLHHAYIPLDHFEWILKNTKIQYLKDPIRFASKIPKNTKIQFATVSRQAAHFRCLRCIPFFFLFFFNLSV